MSTKKVRKKMILELKKEMAKLRLSYAEMHNLTLTAALNTNVHGMRRPNRFL